MTRTSQSQEGRHQRVLDHVHGGVGGREGYRDQPPGRHEAQEAQHKHLPFQNESSLSSIAIEP